jgi:hypothetical protein
LGKAGGRGKKELKVAEESSDAGHAVIATWTLWIEVLE